MRPVYWIILGWIAVSFITAMGLGSFETVAAMSAYASGPTPYFVSEQFLFLYIWIPILVLSSGCVLLAPGLLFALSNSKTSSSFPVWLFSGFVFGIFAVPILVSAIQQIIGAGPIRSGQFLGLLSLISAVILIQITRKEKTQAINWSIFDGRSRELVTMAVVPLIILLLMTPKFYWESLNGDGGHFLLNATMFIHRGIPFWPPEAGAVSGYPGMTNLIEVFPSSSLVRLFGVNELAARATFLLGLPVLISTVFTLIRLENGPKLTPAAMFSIALVMILYAFVLAFNPSYNPYFADIALPMAREPYLLIAFFGFIFFFYQSSPFGMVFFAFLTFVSAPNGLILLGFFLAANFVASRPLPWAKSITAGLLVALAIAIAILAMMALQMLDLLPATQEFGGSAILNRLRYISFWNTERLAFWVLPSGILPAFALFFWPAHDRISRTLVLVTIVYVGFFYFQAYRILPHHFAPAMVLPVIVFWRSGLVRFNQTGLAFASVVGIGLATVLSWPNSLTPHMYTKEFGQRIAININPDDAFSPDRIRIVQNISTSAFPMNYSENAPQNMFIVETTAWYPYARITADPDSGAAYSIHPVSSENPRFPVQISDVVDGYAMYVKDRETYDADRSFKGLQRTISDTYYVPRTIVFGAGSRVSPYRIWDLAELAGLR